MAEVRHKGRIALLAGAILFVFSGIVVRLCFLHLYPADWVVHELNKQKEKELTPVASRGKIVDRNGMILALDRPLYNVFIDPKYIGEQGNGDVVLEYLPKFCDVSHSDLRAMLARTNRQYLVVQHDISPSLKSRFKQKGLGVDVSVQHPGAAEPEMVYLAGVKIGEVPERSYPKGALMAHVVGFANHNGDGSAGVEYRFDKLLKGREGRRVSKRDGRKRELYGTRVVDIPPENGATVELTLDEELQNKVEQAIERMCMESNAKAGWAMIQHVRTGEILAMASFPTFDLNRFGRAPAEWQRNRAISYTYEPGSTMKAAVIASALDKGIVKETDLIDCENGYWVYGGRKLEDSHGEGIISVADIIKCSSNIGTAKIALMMGDQLLYDSIKAFNFSNRLGVGLPGEEGGIFSKPKHWSKISATRIGMGHEINVTALQVLSMMSTIAYNGVQMKPYVVKRVVAADGEVLLQNEPQKLGAPIEPSTALLMQKLLQRVTEEEGGTGRKARIEGYHVAGKTGTAQKVRPKSEGGGYYSKNFISSFAGFLPVESPEIAIVVVADDPGIYTESGRKIKYYGGTVCGPVFSEIGEFAVRYLRIAPDGGRVYVARPDQ